ERGRFAGRGYDQPRFGGWRERGYGPGGYSEAGYGRGPDPGAEAGRRRHSPAFDGPGGSAGGASPSSRRGDYGGPGAGFRRGASESGGYGGFEGREWWQSPENRWNAGYGFEE